MAIIATRSRLDVLLSMSLAVAESAHALARDSFLESIVYGARITGEAVGCVAAQFSHNRFDLTHHVLT